MLVVLAFTLFRLVKAGTKGELGQALRTFISPTEEWGPRFVSKNINISRQLVLDQKLVKADQYKCARKLRTVNSWGGGSNGANGSNGSADDIHKRPCSFLRVVSRSVIDFDQYYEYVTGRTEEGTGSRTRGSLSQPQLFAQLTQFKCVCPDLNVFTQFKCVCQTLT